MPLNKLDNFIKNTEGRILYVSPSDLDSTDNITNQGNSLAQPFKTLQRAILEAARFSYQRGTNNDIVEKTTILLMPGEHPIDNRPGYAVYDDGTGTAKAVSPSGTTTVASDILSLSLSTNFDLTQEDNILYKFNSVYGGVVVPRGTSIVGLDLRKTKIRPKYVPNPTDSAVAKSAIFRITGACYFWQFCLFDGNELELVYTDPTDFSTNNQSSPTFSHHKLTCFEYADGVNQVGTYGLTDLDMYYSKLSNAFNLASGRDIDDKFPSEPGGFSKQRPEWEIVGAFAPDPIQITSIESGQGGTASPQITVVTAIPHEFTAGTPIKIKGVGVADYNVSTKIQNIINSTTFTYLLSDVRANLPTSPSVSNATVTIETDTVSGASPYIFNISLRSVWGMNGMNADGSKASGFRSMVVAQFTGVSLQKDDRAFVKYNSTSRNYESIQISRVAGETLSSGSASTNANTTYHLDSGAIYRTGWESSHIIASNDSFIQVVSVFAIGFNRHFDVRTGGDLSITNSNSNFGQISLSATGFKKESFTKDDKAFITSIIAPRAITSNESNVDWVTFDVAKTISVANSGRLYLYGYTSVDDIPPILTQGFRIGAKLKDKLYLSISGVEYSANILMSDGVTSSVKEHSVTTPSSNIFTTSSTHTIQTGEKVLIFSNDGDLPENLAGETIYYAIRVSSSQIKLASSPSNASNGTAITVSGGTNLKILSRVSDKSAGEIGSPVQYDSTNNQWFIYTNSNSEIYNIIVSLGVAVLSERTEPSYVKRFADSRSLDERIYKIRVVIPKETTNAKKPDNGFIIQESSTTGVRSDTDFTISSISELDYEYNRNPRFISTCSVSSTTVTTISEKPHDLKTGDIVIIKNVTDTSSSGTSYNGTYEVTVVDDMTFTYPTTDVDGIVHVPGTCTNNTSLRTTNLPKFERNDFKSNVYIYRNEVITEYIQGIQDGVYHIYTLNASNTVTDHFTSLKYSQNIVDLYPQNDRDNVNDNPYSAVSFAKRSPLGEVVTNDLKKSITRETTDKLINSLGIGLDVSTVSNSSTSATITFDRPHGLSGIVTYSSLSGGSGRSNGTYYNVKLFNDSGLTAWNGATAKVVVSGGTVTGVDITASGSGYSAGTYYLDTARIGGVSNNSTITVTTSGISTSVGNVVQFTGAGTTSEGYYRVTSIPAKNQISIAKTSGDPIVNTSQYGLIIGPSVRISTTSTSADGTTTFNCSSPHGLLAGNRFKVVDSNNNNLGDYIVNARVGVNTFTSLTNTSISAANGYILKHGLSANEGISDSSLENIGVRDVSLYDDEILTVVSFTTDTQIRVSSPISAAGITKRFPLGSYIQIDGEIMRITSSTLVGGFNDAINVIRGSLGTLKTTHDVGSLIRKIKPIAIEFRRPAILRASGHTFEYLGYGPGNYSTGLPQVQIRSLTEREDFLVQSQERSGGLVVYTGMNSNGDVFNGNTKTSASSGEVISYDIPKPTTTGSDPSRLSAVFDEVTIKERLVVEGGNSGTVLSQFDGPITLNKEVKINGQTNITAQLKVTNSTESTSSTSGSTIISGGVGIGRNLNVAGVTSLLNTTQSTTKDNGALIVEGGVGIEKNINVGGNATVAGTLAVTGSTTLSSTLGVTGATTLSSTLNVSGVTTVGSNLNVSGVINATTPNSGTSGGVRIAANATTNNAYLQFLSSNLGTEYALLTATSTSLTLGSSSGTTIILNDNVEINGALSVTGDITAFASDERLKTNIKPLENALEKVLSLSGFTYNFNQIGESLGFDKETLHVGVSAQQIQAVLPEAIAPAPANNDYLTVKYEKIVPLLIEAIKELSTKVESLEQKLTDK